MGSCKGQGHSGIHPLTEILKEIRRRYTGSSLGTKVRGGQLRSQAPDGWYQGVAGEPHQRVKAKPAARVMNYHIMCHAVHIRSPIRCLSRGAVGAFHPQQPALCLCSTPAEPHPHCLMWILFVFNIKILVNYRACVCACIFILVYLLNPQNSPQQ